MKIRYSIIAGIVALAPVATADKVASVESTKVTKEAMSVDTVVQRHIAALGGEKLLRAGKTFSYTVSGEKMGKKFTKTVHHARPGLLRVDIQTEDGPMSKGFDGKVAWTKKGTAATEMLTPEETLAMKAHAEFDEPLLDYSKRGTAVKLVGTSEVQSKPAYDLEVTLSNGEVEHHLIDASSFLLVKRTYASKNKDGKVTQGAVRYGDYKSFGGRMVNQSIEFVADDGKVYKSTISNVAWDKPMDAKIFAMPK